MSKARGLQVTLALLKPDITPMPYSVNRIQDMILEHDFLVVRSKIYPRLPRSRVEDFYGEHRGKFFFNRLVTFMSSGSVHAYVLAREDAIQHWRALMGPTKVFKTRYVGGRGHVRITT